jgi:hypothetical protein
MKMISTVLAILVFTSLGHSQSGPATTTETATVYFMRSTGWNGSATAFTVFIDDAIVCRLNNKRYSIHSLSPGKHVFSSQFAGKKSKEKAERIEIDAEAGKTYYIQLIFQPGFVANNLYCQEVTENSAKKVLPGLEQDKNCQ